MNTLRSRTIVVVLVLLTCAPGAAQAQAPRPNVVFIVLDDAGFADLGSFGSEIRTPNMDALATGGLRFTNFQTTGLCSPSRAALLTGRNHHTVGVRMITNFASDAENNRGRITPRAATLAEMLRDQGYSTLAVGKWHLTPLFESTPAGPFDNWPLGKGFERYFGFLDGGTDQWHPELVSDNHHVEPAPRERYHLTEDLIDQAITFVGDQRSSRPDKPFFLYLALGAPHAPHQAPRSFIDHYKGVYDKGWDQIRAERLSRQQRLGIAPANAMLTPRNTGVKPWTELGADDRRVMARFMENYAGFVEHADTHLGRLTAFLKEVGAFDDTLIVLISDNGASQEGGLSGTTNLMAGANGLATDTAYNAPRMAELGSDASQANYPQGWAQVSNTPFQRYKQNVHYGGVRDPLIMHWTQGIRSKGGIRAQFHHLVDIVPTVLEIIGVQAPTVYRGVPQLPIAGVSMAYAFDGVSAPSRHVTQYFEMYGHRGVYHDGWKAVTFHLKGTPFDRDTWELYHVADDWSEAHDLAARDPERLGELKALFEREAARFGALPLDDRTFELRDGLKFGAPPARNSWTFYSPRIYVNTNAAPNLKNRSHALNAAIHRDAASQHGVLIAHGDVTGGYTLYIRNNRLVYEYNRLGSMTTVSSNVDVPAGDVTARMVFTKTGELEGLVTLYIGDAKVGEAPLRNTMPNVISYEGLSIGRDALSPVSPAYAALGEFPFTGTLRSVTIEVR